MILNIDEYNAVNAMIPGLFQFSENDLFTQAELAVTDDELLIYDDSAPDEINGDNYHYAVKKRISLDDIKVVLIEKIIHNREMSNLGRLEFAMMEDDQTVVFYFYVEDRKLVSNFVDTLEELHIKCKKTKIDLSRENL